MSKILERRSAGPNVAEPAPPPASEPAAPSARAAAPLTPARSLWAVVIRTFAFLRKEVVEILRQPKLIALLVVGPFVLLMLFGYGYGETSIEKRAIFVGPPGSMYEDVLVDYEDQLSGFLESAGMVATVEEGRAALDAGDVDVVVVFPERPQASILEGERAVIEVLHNEIDPIQEGAIEVASRIAIQEVNATVLATITADFQTEIASKEELRDQLTDASERLMADPIGARDQLRSALPGLRASLDGSATILDRLQVDDTETLDQLDRARVELSAVVDEIDRIDENTSDAELEAISDSVRALAGSVDEAVVLDPDVLVRPFTSDTDNVLEDRVSANDYFTPGSLALLLQHLALTFAALSLVRDRRTGLFELMRVGPLSSIEIIVGKIVAYLLVGSLVAAALVSASVFFLGVPMAGSVLWLAAAIVGVLISSMALGMVLAILSGTESQAVQYAMLTLLAGLFFSGFALPIDNLSYPVRYVSWLLPVTYGIDSTQDVMLRGVAPSTSTLIGLGALIVVYGAVATLGLKRQLRTSGV